MPDKVNPRRASLRNLFVTAYSRLLNVFRVMYQGFTLTILKVNPNPVSVSANAVILFVVKNTTDEPIQVRISGTTDEGYSIKRQDLLVPAKTEIIGSTNVDWHTAGSHQVTISGSKPTGQVIKIPNNPYFPSGFQEVPLYGPEVSDQVDVLVYSGAIPGSIPPATNIGPTENNGSTYNGSAYNGTDAAGVIGALAGTSNSLYALAKGSGIWKSINQGPWTQLQGSPARAHCIAMDPVNFNNLAVGERDSDSVDPHLDQCGLWESNDAGNTWYYSFDPVIATGVQRIYAVIFTRDQTLLIGTQIGIGRKTFFNRLNTNTFEFPGTGLAGPITAFAVSETKVWARTANNLLVSTDDGATWATIAIPATINLPGFGIVNVNLTTNFNQNDVQSLAAFDAFAYVLFAPQDGAGNNPTGNKSCLLIFNVAGNNWIAQTTNDNDGRGLGGRRFIKSYVLKCPGTNRTIGDGLRLYYGAGQGIQEAASLNADLTINWSNPVYTDFAGNPNPGKHIHSDLWDFHLGNDYCPPKEITAWVACDGGVFKSVVPGAGVFTRNNPQFNGYIESLDWVTHNEGFSTHNIHGLNVFPAPFGSADNALLMYVTQDNDAWWRTNDGNWNCKPRCGDVNWCAGDALYRKNALIVRTYDGGTFCAGGPCSVLVSMDGNLPGGSDLDQFVMSKDGSLEGPTGFQVIQTPGYEDLPDSLDAVMLVNLPLQDDSGNSIPDPPGGTLNGARQVLLRNKKFSDDPEGPGNKFKNWAIEADNFPMGTVNGFWAAGGHANPVYYLVVNNSLLKGSKQNGSWSWGNALANGLVTKVAQPGFSVYHQQGPVFVNPYNPNIIFTVTSNRNFPNGVISFTTDGINFTPDEALTALATRSGQYPLGSFYPVTAFGIVGNAFHGTAMYVPSQIAFNPDNPSEIVVASPFTGVFFANIARGCFNTSSVISREERWKDLSPFLPRPCAYICSVGFNHANVIIGTEGSGVLEIQNVAAAPPASYIDPVRTLVANTQSLGTLRDATSEPVPYCLVTIAIEKINSPAAGSIFFEEREIITRNQQVITDSAGQIIFARVLDAGNYIIRLNFPGDGSLASCSANFLLTV